MFYKDKTNQVTQTPTYFEQYVNYTAHTECDPRNVRSYEHLYNVTDTTAVSRVN